MKKCTAHHQHAADVYAFDIFSVKKTLHEVISPGHENMRKVPDTGENENCKKKKKIASLMVKRRVIIEQFALLEDEF